MKWVAFWQLVDAAAGDPGLAEARVQALSEEELAQFYADCRARARTPDDEQRLEPLAQLADREYRARYAPPIRDVDDPPATEMLWADFWALIEAGREDPAAVAERIEAMTEQELVNCWWRFQDAVEAITWDGQDAAAATWVVQQGKAAYDEVVARPWTFPDEAPAVVAYQGEVAATYEARYGTEVRDRDYPPPEHLELEPDAFWAVVDSGLDDRTVAERRIRAMSEQELVDFYARYEDAVAELLDGPYAFNAFHSGLPHSEDHQLDIAEWIVQRGRRFYAFHLDPKRFPLDPGAYEPGYNHFAFELYEERYGTLIRWPEDPPPATATPTPARRKGLLARLFGHGDP
jgi:hypothetical protein